MRPPLHVRELNRAREWYNPLRGLDVQRVVALLEEAERGKYDGLQKLNRMAEKRHPALRALKRRRLAALKKLDWSIKVPETLPRGMTVAQADAQAKFLRGRYEGIENLPEAIEFMGLAEFRIFSHLEKHYEDGDERAPITRLQPVPQWHWCRDQEDFGLWRYDAEARGNFTTATGIEPANFIIREVDDALCEVALLCFIRRGLAKRNWTVFQEDYALASIFAKLGENTPLDKVKEWLALVKEVTGNSRGALPPGADIEALDLGNLDGVQFENFIKAEDSDLILAGTSGLLTMLTAQTGMGSDGQSDAHEASFDALAIAEAMEISAIFQAQHDKPLLRQEFPSQPPVAYFELAAQDTEDLGALAERLVKLRQAGFVAQAQQLEEKFGLKLQPAPAPSPAADPGQAGEAAAALANRAAAAQLAAAGNEARFLASAEALLAEADRATLQPVIARVAPIRAELARLAALDEKDDAAFAAGLEALQPQLRALQAELPALERQVLTGRPYLEEAFTDIIGTAFLSGAVSHAEAAKKGVKTP
ncbi:MAG: DUF935 family protein [Verrucomicrobia bacterium]|nr:DUF935 family protein [Verrucomicrobiota bacterium]